VIVYAGAATAYKAKLQHTITESFTKAEFIATIYTAKAVKHLCSILNDLGLLSPKATVIYKDNRAAIGMTNKSKPTARSCHIDIQHFAIQESRNHGKIEMQYTPSIINPAEHETKALSWILHSHHLHKTMGHYGPFN